MSTSGLGLCRLLQKSLPNYIRLLRQGLEERLGRTTVTMKLKVILWIVYISAEISTEVETRCLNSFSLQRENVNLWLYLHAAVCITARPGFLTTFSTKRKMKLPLKYASTIQSFKPIAQQSWRSSSVLFTHQIAFLMLTTCPAKSSVVASKNSVFLECESLESNGRFLVLSSRVKLTNLAVLVDTRHLRLPRQLLRKTVRSKFCLCNHPGITTK